MKNLSKIMMAVMMIVVAAGVAVAETSVTVSEREIITALSEENSFMTENATHDPFKPVIKKREPVIIKIEQPSENKNTAEEKKEVVKPVQLTITGICGNNTLRQAVVVFENNEYTVSSGQIINGVFRVIDIEHDKITIYSIREARRHVFRLS